jgi:dihydroorotate dehydrogenase (NAD+) catalytic subunit
VDAGADVLSLVNTFVGMSVNIHTWRPMLANKTGGLSGPAIRPMAVAMVHQVYTAVAKPAGIPLIGMGGIQTWQDAVEFLLAGATGLAVGTALFVDPTTPLQILDGLTDYLRQRKIEKVTDLVGQLQV